MAPSMVNDNISQGGRSYDQGLNRKAFFIERIVSFLVLSSRNPRDMWFLSPAIGFLIISNFLYISSYINAQVASEKKSQRGEEPIQVEDLSFWMERIVAIYIFVCWVPSHEIWRWCFWFYSINLILCSNLFYIKCYLFPEDKEKFVEKNHKQQKKAQKWNGQGKAKHDFTLKESKKEVTSSNEEELQSVEAKYLTKMERQVDLLKKNIEEERNQLMYELGATRASVEIYKELLHDLHYHQP